MSQLYWNLTFLGNEIISTKNLSFFSDPVTKRSLLGPLGLLLLSSTFISNVGVFCGILHQVRSLLTQEMQQDRCVIADKSSF